MNQNALNIGFSHLFSSGRGVLFLLKQGKRKSYYQKIRTILNLNNQVY